MTTNKKTVLIIDDSATVRQQVRIALTDAGFEVLEAADGDDGIVMIDATAELAVVICDVNMPRMSGIELLGQVRSRLASLPVLMLTTESQPALVQRAKQAGAHGWILKPFRPHILVAAVQKLAGLRHGAVPQA